MRFTIVIVHRNGEQMLLNALSALMQSIGEQDEVILVDNGSTDRSLARVRASFSAVTIIDNGCNKGFSRACNQGLKRARGEYVLFLNNDAFLPAGALDRFAEDFLTIPNLALIGGRLAGEDGRPQRSAGTAPTFFSELGVAKRRHPDIPTSGEPVEVETLVGACMAFRREVADTVGALDEDFFFYFEETEWCVRLRRHGWLVMVDPRVQVTHLKGGSTRGLRRDAQIEAFRSRLLYYRKTMPNTMAMTLTVWRIARLMVNLIVNLTLTMFTFGLIKNLRTKLAVYFAQFSWLLWGCPDSWGLPDKCPQRG